LLPGSVRLRELSNVAVKAERVFQMRRFRVGLVALVSWPWVLGIVICLATWRAPSARWLVPLLLDTMLVFASLRKPWGLAPVFILLSYVLGAVLWSLPGGAVWWSTAIHAVEAAALVWLLWPIWRERGMFRVEHDSRHRERVERAYEAGDRHSSSRRTERELRRAGLDAD
jgi:hypothetical protein